MKRILSLTLSVILLLNMCLPVFSVSLDTAEDANEAQIYLQSNANKHFFEVQSLRNEAFSDITANDDGTITVTAAGTGTLYIDNGNVLDTTVYNKLVLTATEDLRFQLYFRTTTSGGLSEANKLTAYTTIKADDTYNYYIFDLSSHAAFTGEIPAVNTVMMLGCKGTGSTTVKEMYLTDTVPEGMPEEEVPDEETPEENENEHHYAVTSLRNEAFTSLTKNDDGTVTVQASGTGTFYIDNDKVLDTAKFGKFVVVATSDLKYQLYFRTTTSGRLSEANKITSYTTLKADDTYNYYVFDLSAHSAYQGDVPAISTAMMLSTKGTGSAVIKDVYFATSSPEGLPDDGDEPEVPSQPEYEYHFDVTAMRNDALSGVTVNADKTVSVTANGTGTFYVDSADVLDTAAYNKFILTASEDLRYMLYFRTSESGSMSEANKLTSYTVVDGDDGYKHFVFDLSAHSAYKGNVPAANTVFMLSFRGTGNTVIKNMYITDSEHAPKNESVPVDPEIPVFDGEEYRYTLSELRNEGFASLEITSNGSLDASVTTSGTLYFDHTAILDTAFFNKFVVLATVNPGFQLYFKTTESGGMSEINKITTCSMIKYDDEYSYYVFDLSSAAAYSGNVATNTGFMLAAKVASSFNIKEIYLANKEPESVYNEYRYSLTSLRNEGFASIVKNSDGTLSVEAKNGGVLYFDNTKVLDTTVYNKFIIKATANPAFKLYFRTAQSGLSETNTLKNYTEIKCAGGYSYYVYDLSSHGNFTGEMPISMPTLMLSATGEATSVIKEIYLSDSIPETDIRVHRYDLHSLSEDGIASVTKESDGSVSIAVENTGTFYFSHPEGLSTRVYKSFVVHANNDLKPQLYFRTTQSGSMSETNKLMTYTTVKDKELDGYSYYVFDLYEHSAFSGELYKNNGFMLNFRTSGEANIKDIYITNDPPSFAPNDVVEIRIDASADSITENEGVITLIPYLLLGDGRVVRNAVFTTNSECAAIVKNADGTATLTGKLDGEITVRAYFAEAAEYAERSFTVSGQSPRIAVSSYKVLSFGNSITKHAPAANLGWTGNWGMAASSEDKDYLHRLQFYMDEKYGAGDVSVVYGASTHSFETSIPSDDYSGAYFSMLERIKEENPDIITVQMGENVASSTEEQYYEAMKSFVLEIKKIAPDARLVLVTPFWPSAEKVAALRRINKEYDISVAEVFMLGESRENMAYGLFENAGVQHHPGDLGMDRMAQIIFTEINLMLSENEKTVYSDLPEDIVFEPAKTYVDTPYEQIKFEAHILPETAVQSVIWSVDNKDLATIDQNGVFTAKNNGMVRVSVCSQYDESINAYVDITILGQTTPYTVTYDKNTDDTVTNMPEPNTLAKEGFVFDPIFPERRAYRFLGWSLTKDGDVVETIDVTRDTTVYAIWEKAVRWDFEREGYFEGFTVEDGFHQFVKNGRLQSTATGTDEAAGNVLTVKSPVLDVSLNDVYAFVIKMKNTAFDKDSRISLLVETDMGTLELEQPVTSTETVTYEFFVPNEYRNALVTGFEFKPTNIDCTVFIDEIAFETDAPSVVYNKNTDDAVTNFPGNEYGVSGEYNLTSIKPERTGYTFLGWSKAADSKLLIEESVAIEAVSEFFAVWDKNDHWEMDSIKDYSINGVNLSKTYVNDGVLHYEANTNDPIIYPAQHPKYGVDSTSGKLKIKMKWSASEDMTSQVYYRTSSYPTLTEANSSSVKLEAFGQNPADWCMVEIDLSRKSTFDGILEYFRFDLTSAIGTADIDYIRFTDSEANIVTNDGETRKITTDDACYIVKKGGCLAPQGTAYISSLALSGDVNTENGYLVVTDKLECSDLSAYNVYILDMADVDFMPSDKMYIGETEVDAIDGAAYFYNDGDAITFKKSESTSDIAMQIKGKQTVYVGGEATQYTADFTGEISDKTVKWFVNNKDIAEIDENTGVLTVYKEGSIRITAVSVNDANVCAALNVEVKYYDFSLEIEGETDLRIDGKEKAFKVVFNGYAPDKSVVWSVDNGKFASVDQNGVLDIYTEGTFNLTVTSLYNPKVCATVPVQLSFVDFNARISGPSAISKASRTEKYSFVIDSAEIYDRSAKWYVDDESLAFIDVDTGRLTPVNNGVVKITAISNCNPRVKAYFEVALTNQTGLFEITYNTADSENVQNMPGTQYGRGKVELSDLVPEREGYVFAGWTDSPYSTDVIDRITVSENVAVYAVWYKALYNFHFNGTSHDFSMNSIKAVAGDTCLEITSTSDDPVMTVKTDFDSDRGSKVLVCFSTESEYDFAQMYYAADGKAISEASSSSIEYHSKGTEDFQKILFDMESSRLWNGRVTSLRFDLLSMPQAVSYIDYILVLDNYRTVTFDKNTDDEVIGMPESLENALFGNHITVNAKPEREGYTFAGWARSADSSTASKTFTVNDDITLYAVWDDGSGDVTVEESEKNTSVSSGKSESGKEYPYDYTVTDVVNDGTRYEPPKEEVAVENMSPAERSKLDEDIVFHFRTAADAEFFARAVVIDLSGTSDEVAKLVLKGKDEAGNGPSLYSTSLELNADTHRYIIIKAKQNNLTNDKLSIYFARPGESFSESRRADSKVPYGEYDMMIYDMSQNVYWEGTIAKFYFSFALNTTGNAEIDWIMFADEIPSMNAVDGGTDYFSADKKKVMPFVDVNAGDWFEPEVEAAYSRGLITGVTKRLYNPCGNVTVAEAITLAVRLNRIYYGLDPVENSASGNWYDTYVAEAINAGIISGDEFASYDTIARRRDVAVIMAKALPDGYLKKINPKAAVPDVSKDDASYDSVLKLYKAGVLIGSDNEHNFLPDTNITRAEMAAIVNRMADAKSRKKI